MQMGSIVGIVMEAVRVYLYARCFRACIGEYKIQKRATVIFFVILWGINSIIANGSKTQAPGFLIETAVSQYCIEVPFLLAASFFYRGTMMRRIQMTLLLPLVYQIEKWTILSALFGIHSLNQFEYFIGSVIALAVFGTLELVMERDSKSRQEREREMLEQEIRIYENQFQLIRQSQEHIRALKHDMKHHIKMLSDMILGGEGEAALQYLSSMSTFMESGEEYIASGNEKIDSILNYMIARATSAGIDVKWKICVPERLEISTFDINVILSNLMENALDALQRVESPRLFIQMEYERGVLYIRTENNFAAKKTEVRQTGEHGYGLKNIQRITEKYHGSLEITQEEGVFQAMVLLFLTETEV